MEWFNIHLDRQRNYEYCCRGHHADINKNNVNYDEEKKDADVINFNEKEHPGREHIFIKEDDHQNEKCDKIDENTNNIPMNNCNEIKENFTNIIVKEKEKLVTKKTTYDNRS